MPRKISFKQPHHHLMLGGRMITSAELTPELYDELITIAPAHASLFDVIEEAPVKEAKSKGDKD